MTGPRLDTLTVVELRSVIPTEIVSSNVPRNRVNIRHSLQRWPVAIGHRVPRACPPNGRKRDFSELGFD